MGNIFYDIFKVFLNKILLFEMKFHWNVFL